MYEHSQLRYGLQAQLGSSLTGCCDHPPADSRRGACRSALRPEVARPRDLVRAVHPLARPLRLVP